MYSSNDVVESGKDNNIKRKITLKDIMQFLASKPEYCNSKLLQAAILKDNSYVRK